MIYIHDNYSYDPCITPIKYHNWEGICVKIMNNNKNAKNICISNIYRPPREYLKDEVIQGFIDELNQTITKFNKTNSNFILLEDLNIDLLKLEKKSSIKLFFEYIISQGLLPMISYLTRIADHSVTLIDNIFANCNNNKIFYTHQEFLLHISQTIYLIFYV